MVPSLRSISSPFSDWRKFLSATVSGVVPHWAALNTAIVASQTVDKSTDISARFGKWLKLKYGTTDNRDVSKSPNNSHSMRGARIEPETVRRHQSANLDGGGRGEEEPASSSRP